MSSTIVWFAGVGWDQITGTDKRIVLELGRVRPVVWVDPPVSIGRRWGSLGAGAPETVAPGVTRVRVTALPGVTRWGIRTVTDWIVGVAGRVILRALDSPTVVVAHPLTRFPRHAAAARILFVTDDWLDGAPLMGLSLDRVRDILRSNLDTADGIAAVTPHLLDLVSAERTADAHVATRIIANGAPAVSAEPGPRERVAGLVGQINERLDLAALEAVISRGVPLRIIGPRADRDPEFARRFDRLVASPSVDWLGPVPSSELPAQLARLGVGLTPYLDSPFNRSSFPLKTLEYLSAGLAVVSSDLPASRWIDSSHVVVAPTADEFADAVVAELDAPAVADAESARQALAVQHGWDRRALEFLELVDIARVR